MIRSTGPTMSTANWGRLFMLALLWGLSFPLIKIIVRELPAISTLFGRVLLATLALGAAMVLTRTAMPRGRAAWFAFFAMGLLGNVIPWALQAWGQKQLPVGLASILNAATPAFSVVVMHVFTEDRATAGRALGVLLGFAGVAALIGPGLLFGAHEALGAEIAFVVACVFYAFSGLVGRRFGRLGLSPLQTAFGLMAATTLMAVPVWLVVDRPWSLPAPGMQPIVALATLAVVSTAVAYILFFRILVEAGPTNVMLVTLLVPVTAMLIAVTFMGETIMPRHLGGMALIGLGLVAIDGRAIGALRRRLGRA